MAAALKDQFGEDVPAHIASMIVPVYPAFSADRFAADALHGFSVLELMPRGLKIAQALRQHLPSPFPEAVEILIASLGPKLERNEGNGMSVFLYLPHVLFVAQWGLEHFEESMRAQYELTQRFTAEFSIRPFLEKYPDESLDRLRQWAGDESAHVRRLVSEGTRPRLPWAPRLRRFQSDPTPVLSLLELLKDDPSPYVRRSVANNLNDIGKDHPDVLMTIARRWMKDADERRRHLLGHALRSLTRQGHPEALALTGYAAQETVTVSRFEVTPTAPRVGDRLRIDAWVTNSASSDSPVRIDCRIHFVKANGRASPKVFALKKLTVGPRGTLQASKTISLADMTTRRHYHGRHRVELLLNGRPCGEAFFDLIA